MTGFSPGPIVESTAGAGGSPREPNENARHSNPRSVRIAAVLPMRRRLLSAPDRHAAGSGMNRCAALLALFAMTLALAGPLLGLSLGEEPTFCCRSGRCCCDSGEDSPSGLDLKAACRCARPDGAALAVALPAGVLALSSTLTQPALAGPLARPPALVPREGERQPPDQPPRFSRATY